MLRLVLLIVGAFVLAFGLDWLAANPGTIRVDWLGHVAEPTVFQAVVALVLLLGTAIFAYNLARQIWLSPAAIGGLFNRRRQKRGLEALSTGLIALGAGDRQTAMRYAVQARRTLPNEPLTHLLRAQAAQLAGDSATSRRIYEAMLSSPDTEQLGLRGLYLEAQSEGETEAARQFAERAMRVNPKLGWAFESLFDLQCKQKDWDAALGALTAARKNGHLDKATADRKRAVLLTAQAQIAEDADPERALKLASEAHDLAPDLIPAAAIAGRLLASRGSTPKATRIIQQTWKKAPHPDLAVAYAYARIGDSPRDRLMRVRQLVTQTPGSVEGPIALATAAIEAKDFDEARAALEPLTEGRMTQRVCTLMARIEGEQHGDKGRVREWLARAVNAPRDPAWTADGVVSETWQPVSPVTGALDAFQWKVPLEQHEQRDADLIAAKLEELVALGAPTEGARPGDDAKVIEAKPVETKPTSAFMRAQPRPAPAPAPMQETPPRAAEPRPFELPEDAVETVAPAPVSRIRPRPAESEVMVVPRAETHRPQSTEEPAAAAARVAADAASQSPPAVAKAVANGPANGTASGASSASARRPASTKPYVAPRAPDDPGTESEDDRSPLVHQRRL
jgi:HemY protein